MLFTMLKGMSQFRAKAEALTSLRTNGALADLSVVVVRLALVVLISIIISHVHAEPV